MTTVACIGTMHSDEGSRGRIHRASPGKRRAWRSSPDKGARSPSRRRPWTDDDSLIRSLSPTWFRSVRRRSPVRRHPPCKCLAPSMAVHGLASQGGVRAKRVRRMDARCREGYKGRAAGPPLRKEGCGEKTKSRFDDDNK